MGGISISQRSAASKVFREMLLIAFPAPALGGWVESPSPGTSRWVWHRLFVTGALERSIRHSLVSGVGGLRALMGAEDLGLSCCGIKGDLVKNRPRDSSGSSAQAGWAQAALPDAPGSPVPASFGCKSSGRVFSSLGMAFPEHSRLTWLFQALHSLSAPIAPQPLCST